MLWLLSSLPAVWHAKHCCFHATRQWQNPLDVELLGQPWTCSAHAAFALEHAATGAWSVPPLDAILCGHFRVVPTLGASVIIMTGSLSFWLWSADVFVWIGWQRLHCSSPFSHPAQFLRPSRSIQRHPNTVFVQQITQEPPEFRPCYNRDPFTGVV